MISLGLQCIWILCITGFAFSCKRLHMLVDYADISNQGKLFWNFISSFFFLLLIPFNLVMGYVLTSERATYILLAWVGVMFWMFSLIYHIRAYVVAAKLKNSYSQIFKNLMVSFGSLCFASLLLGITGFFTMIFGITHKVVTLNTNIIDSFTFANVSIHYFLFNSFSRVEFLNVVHVSVEYFKVSSNILTNFPYLIWP